MAHIKFDKIGPKEIKIRVQQNFSGSYLTLISIIQGVAFGIWYTNVSEIFVIPDFGIHLLVYPAFSLLSIVLVVFYYSWFVSIIYTPPDFPEAIIPILLATFEIAPMYFFNYPNIWWYCVGLFYLTGIIGFLNTIRNIRRNEYCEGTENIKSAILLELKINIGILLLMTFLAFWSNATYPISYNFKNSFPSHDKIFLFVHSVLIVIMIYKTHKFLNIVFSYSGLRVQDKLPKKVN